MKAFLKGKIAELNTKKTKIIEASTVSEDVVELKGFNARMEELNGEIKSFEEQLGKLEVDDVPPTVSGPVTKGFNPITAFYGLSKGKGNENSVEADDVEYRKAFMEYVLKGETIPSSLQKASTAVTTEDIGVVIPQNVVNKILKKLDEYGRIFPKLRHTSMKGGVSYPIENITPVAYWVAEGAIAPESKEKVAKVDFKYHKLQCRVGITLEASATSLDMFERAITEDVHKAMVRKIESSVISGTGVNEPLGFTKSTDVPTVEVTASELGKYQTYTKIRAKLKSGYRSGAVWLLNQSDWDTHVVGMVDSTGQPIARVTVGLNGVPEERLLGIPVLLVDDDYLDPFEAATAADVFGALVNFNYYAFNSNMKLNMRRYFDEDRDTWFTKATLIGDGGLLLSEAAVLLKKA